MNTYELYPRFAALFSGLDTAFGTGKGQWIKRPPQPDDWLDHLQGRGPGMGIAPLRADNKVKFAAIDLDEPDFDAAREMQTYIPGCSWLEESRSGNAHCWVFFKEPIDAWVAQGILREATLAAGKEHVEVFPKQTDFARVKLGSYINLPFHGRARPIVNSSLDVDAPRPSVLQFIEEAETTLNAPAEWQKKAEWLMLGPPSARAQTAEFGNQDQLHVCARHIIDGDAGPIVEGHRNAVLFTLAKCLTNWNQVDAAEAQEILLNVNNDLVVPPADEHEVLRILRNAQENRYTSTSCDDPLFAAFRHPSCNIGV